MTKSVIGYHGSPQRFNAFDNKCLGLGNDQLGTGFYFFDNAEAAWSYSEGGWLYKCEIDLGKTLSTEKVTLSKQTIFQLLTPAPAEILGYFCSDRIGREGITRREIRDTVSFLLENSSDDIDLITEINANLYNYDMPKGYQVYASCLHFLGYGGYAVRPRPEDSLNYVVFDSSRIEILERTPVNFAEEINFRLKELRAGKEHSSEGLLAKDLEDGKVEVTDGRTAGTFPGQAALESLEGLEAIDWNAEAALAGLEEVWNALYSGG